jgi:fucose permease
MACLLFLQSGVEFTMGGYVSTYLTRSLGMSVAAASWVLAAYWAAIMIARLVLRRFLVRTSSRSVFIVCAAGASAAAGATALAPAPAYAAAGICFAGLALTGGTLLPWASGHIASFAGLPCVFGLVAAGLALISALGVEIGRLPR